MREGDENIDYDKRITLYQVARIRLRLSDWCISVKLNVHGKSKE